MPLPYDARLMGLRDDEYEAEGLMLKLPPTRGPQTPNAPLAAQSWFRAGGQAEVLFKPVDVDDLSFFLAHCPQNIPLTFLGAASNTLIRDGGVPGVVIKLGPTFSTIRTSGDTVVAGAAALDINVARTAQNVGIGGLEFLSGIPGTIGGGLRMNAGAYKREFKDVVASVTALDRNGTVHNLSPEEMGFSYRNNAIPADWIFTEAELSGTPDDPEAIKKRMQDIQQSRAESQPIHERTCGSTFANPDDDPQKRKSWQLIEAAGCRGLKIGQAQVSNKHCNFLINTGHATATEIEQLGEEVRRRVKEKFGVTLRWEIRRIGIPLDTNNA